MNSMPRILVTGSTGQVGWELLRALSPLGEIIGVSARTAPLAMDLADPDSIRAVLREVKPALIVNAAAYTAVDKAESELGQAMAVNATGPGILAEEAKRLGAPLIHYSTDYVFDGSKSRPYREDDVPNPLNNYGRSKLAGERAIQSVAGQFLIFRTSWVYGARGKNFLLTMLRLANERRECRIVCDQFGAPTWSRMIAEVTAAALSRGGEMGRGATGYALSVESGCYHLTGSGETSWYGFAQAIFERRARLVESKSPKIVPVTAAEYPLPARRPANSRLDGGKLFRVLGLSCPRWEGALELCMDEMHLSP